MGFARGRYGVEYSDDRVPDGGHPLRLVFAFVALVAAVSFACARGCTAIRLPLVAETPEPAPPAIPPPEPETPPEPAVAVSSAVATSVPTNPPPAAPARPTSETLTRAARWQAAAKGRPATEATLLVRLADAEHRGNLAVARDSLEKLRRSAAMADLEDLLDRRLGELNADQLFHPAPGVRDGWTTRVTVRRGDNLQRLAREHGTTLAAILKLNHLTDANRVRLGSTLRVLEFPRASLLVRLATHTADLTLGGRFFRRYYVTYPADTASGHYPITREQGPLDRFNELHLKFIPSDRDELALLLAPGSYLTLAR